MKYYIQDGGYSRDLRLGLVLHKFYLYVDLYFQINFSISWVFDSVNILNIVTFYKLYKCV